MVARYCNYAGLIARALRQLPVATKAEIRKSYTAHST